jgi:hypothetical protein
MKQAQHPSHSGLEGDSGKLHARDNDVTAPSASGTERKNRAREMGRLCRRRYDLPAPEDIVSNTLALAHYAGN